jgi:DDE superfamily endonuclease
MDSGKFRLPGKKQLYQQADNWQAKKHRQRKLDKSECQHNRSLARLRIFVEHVNRKLKIFRILAERYRNRRKRFGLRFNLISAILNFELASPS